MNNNAWFKKENPLLSLQSMSGGAAGSLMQGAADATKYVDEVFSTYVYEGNGGAHQITNNIDNSGKGGLVWLKNRERDTYASNLLFDTERGSTKYLLSDDNAAEATSGAGTGINTFNEDGFTLQGNGYGSNYNTEDFVSWNFRKQKGFCDIVTYTGTGSATTVSHGLGSVPGLIMIKCTSIVNSWYVYHKDLGATKYMMLNNTNAVATQTWFMNDTTPTSTEFSLGSATNVNGSGETYVAYIFAGGLSTAATARSVYFGGDASLEIPSSSDLTLGTGDFTIETWVYPQSFGNRCTIYDGRSSGGTTGITIGWEATSGQIRVYMNATSGSDIVVQWDGLEKKQWTHIAVTRSSGTVRLFINGTEKDSATRTSDLNNTNAKIIGYRSYTSSSYDHMHGQICNFRLVKGTAVYTSSFIPLTEPLTDITNTKLLCCNNASVTGATVTPGTITVGTGGFAIDPVAYTNSLFDDPDGFKFGADENKNIVKMGKYYGNGSATPVEMNLGWEPQWILIKNTDLSAENWFILDSMRGIVTGSTEASLYTNANSVEAEINLIDLTPIGFKTQTADDKVNGSGHEYIYFAIRRPDGYVGKPPELGTNVFGLAQGAGNPSFPCFVTGFPVDFLLQREFASADSWITGARLTGTEYMYTNSTDAGAGTNYDWGSNTGAVLDRASSYQGWLWKRGAGFDVLAYTGNGVAGRQVEHNLSQTPEMIWVKNRDTTDAWKVYHKGLNGGSSPEDYHLGLNTDDAEFNSSVTWNDTAPTSLVFTLGGHASVNGNDMVAFLFASANDADGNPISKVGSYSGTGSQLSVTTGFQPRFIIIKSTSSGRNWLVFDTLRGWAAGNDAELNLNKSDGQNTSYDFGAPTATGFTAEAVNADINASGHNYIYYAHA